MEELKFMTREDIIGFAIFAQQLRDGAKKYYETNLSGFHPNLYTKKYCEIISKLNSLVRAIQGEVAERAAQIGREEKSRKPIKTDDAKRRKRRKRRKTSEPTTLRKTNI